MLAWIDGRGVYDEREVALKLLALRRRALRRPVLLRA
jgi:hypothetical protein